MAFGNNFGQKELLKQIRNLLQEPCQIETVELFHGGGFNDYQKPEKKNLQMTSSYNQTIKHMEQNIQKQNFVIEKQDKIEKLSILLEMTENFKTIITEVEVDNERYKGFKAQIDGVMCYYKNMFDKYTSK